MAGLAAAWGLGRAGSKVVLFEKSRGVSGRAATRRRHGTLYDHGANFFRTEDPEIGELVHEVLPTAELVEIPGEVWTFDSSGVVKAGDAAQNAVPKYSYRDGIKTLGKLLLSASGAELCSGSRIERLQQGDAGWIPFGTGGRPLGSFDDIVLTPPAPQAAELLRSSKMDSFLREQLVEGLRSAPYRSQFSFVLGFTERVVRPLSVHAFVNSDGNHALSWLSFEEDKAGHVPDNESVLIVQMSPAWTACHYDDPPDLLLPEVVTQVRSLLPELPSGPDWWDSQRWRYAHPEKRIELSTARLAEDSGLHFCGDGLVGRGRVSEALKTGLECARRVTEAGAGGRREATAPGYGRIEPD